MHQEQPGLIQDQVQVQVLVLVLAQAACAGGLSARPERWRLQGKIQRLHGRGSELC